MHLVSQVYKPMKFREIFYYSNWWQGFMNVHFFAQAAKDECVFMNFLAESHCNTTYLFSCHSLFPRVWVWSTTTSQNRLLNLQKRKCRWAVRAEDIYIFFQCKSGAHYIVVLLTSRLLCWHENRVILCALSWPDLIGDSCTLAVDRMAITNWS